MLTKEDVLEHKKFDDAICVSAFPMDIHSPDSASMEFDDESSAENLAFEIPLRSILPIGLNNLIVTGRMIGATHEAAASLRVCPVCMALPGTLPVINQTAVEYAVKAGFALNCNINKFSVFDRKNYFYPDLPKAYQISQLERPLCIDGLVPIEVDGVKKNIRINRIHLEEDAGKLVHDDFNGVSLADYNRCGIPLIEIVTEPDINSAEEAMAFVEQISLLLQYAGVCDCKMEQGSLRCDVNISLMKPDAKEFGTRAEIKNINSIKSVGRAIKYEERRQALLLDAGKRVVQETRRYDANRDTTKSMRSKENAHDYRYFPEPDLMPIVISDEWIEEIKNHSFAENIIIEEGYEPIILRSIEDYLDYSK